jgi:hypothetical protein
MYGARIAAHSHKARAIAFFEPSPGRFTLAEGRRRPMPRPAKQESKLSTPPRMRLP